MRCDIHDTEPAVTLTIDVDLPADLDRFHLPGAVALRLQTLLDRQDAGQPLTEAEREEAEGLVNLAELLTLLRLRSERMAP
jgi:rhodanese-related sulfurtransferase